MGGSSSKTNATVINEAVSELMLASMQSCSNEKDIVQEIVVKGQGNLLSDISMEQMYRSILTCANDTDWMSKLQTDIEDTIKQKADSKSLAFLGVLSESDSSVDSLVSKSVKDSINLKTVSDLVNKTRQKQSIYIEGKGNVLTNITMKQMNDDIASSTQALVGSIDILKKLKTDVDQEAKAAQDDPIANLLKGLSDIISGPIMWIGIIIIGGLIIFVVFMNSGAGASLIEQGSIQAQAYGRSKGLEYDEFVQAPLPPAPTSSMPVSMPVQEYAPMPVQETAPMPVQETMPAPMPGPAVPPPPTGPITLFNNDRLPPAYQPVQYNEGFQAPAPVSFYQSDEGSRMQPVPSAPMPSYQMPEPQPSYRSNEGATYQPVQYNEGPRMQPVPSASMPSYQMPEPQPSYRSNEGQVNLFS
jgi:hypothetical protein